MIHRLDNLDRLVQKRKIEMEVLQEDLHKRSQELSDLRETSIRLQKASLSLAALTNLTYGSSLTSLVELLNYGLISVYMRDLSISVETEIKGNRPSVTFKISEGGADPVDPESAHGGGLAQLLGFLSRLVLIVASGKRRILILDESFSALSEDLLEPLSALIKELTTKLDFQIILVTHQEQLASEADVTYRLINPGEVVKD